MTLKAFKQAQKGEYPITISVADVMLGDTTLKRASVPTMVQLAYSTLAIGLKRLLGKEDKELFCISFNFKSKDDGNYLDVQWLEYEGMFVVEKKIAGIKLERTPEEDIERLFAQDEKQLSISEEDSLAESVTIPLKSKERMERALMLERTNRLIEAIEALNEAVAYEWTMLTVPEARQASLFSTDTEAYVPDEVLEA